MFDLFELFVCQYTDTNEWLWQWPLFLYNKLKQGISCRTRCETSSCNESQHFGWCCSFLRPLDGHSMNHFVIRVIVGEKLIHLWQKSAYKNSMGFEWHPVAVCGITPKQNCIVTSIFYISTSNLKHNLFRHMALILCQIWIKTFCKIFILYNIK